MERNKVMCNDIVKSGMTRHISHLSDGKWDKPIL